MIIASTSLLAEPSSDANAPRTTAFGLADQGGMESLDDPNKNSILPTYRPALRNINLAPESMTAVLQTSGQRLTGVYRHGGRFDIPSFTADNDLGPCFRSALTLAPRSGIARRPRRGEPPDMASVQSWTWDYPGHHAKIDGWQTLSTNLLISRLTSLRGQIT